MSATVDTPCAQTVEQSSPRGSSIVPEARGLRWFILSAAFIFLLTGVAKIISAFGHAAILNNADPIFAIPFRHLMLSVGILELIISGICVFTRKHTLSLGLIAWLTASFIVYRLGLLWTGWQKPCPCLGDLTTALHIPQHTADAILKGILGYLLLGLCGALCWYCKHSQKKGEYANVGN